MNRRNFFASLAALAGAVSISPTIFIPKFEPVHWKKIPGPFPVPDAMWRFIPGPNGWVDVGPIPIELHLDGWHEIKEGDVVF